MPKIPHNIPNLRYFSHLYLSRQLQRWCYFLSLVKLMFSKEYYKILALYTLDWQLRHGMLWGRHQRCVVRSIHFLHIQQLYEMGKEETLAGFWLWQAFNKSGFSKKKQLNLSFTHFRAEQGSQRSMVCPDRASHAYNRLLPNGRLRSVSWDSPWLHFLFLQNQGRQNQYFRQFQLVVGSDKKRFSKKKMTDGEKWDSPAIRRPSNRWQREHLYRHVLQRP